MAAVRIHPEQKAEKRKVRAIARIRPIFNHEIPNPSPTQELDSCVIPIPPNTVAFRQQRYDQIIEQTFKFDAMYDPTSTQSQIFEQEVQPLIEHVVNGKRCTVFCYGPTGSGKTFTAFGAARDGKFCNVGVMGRTIQCILDRTHTLTQTHSHHSYQCFIKLSALEIYNEKAYDLLSKEHNFQHGLPVRTLQNEVIVQGLTMTKINSMEEYCDLYDLAIKRRTTAFTALNAHSSRSHAMFTIYMEQVVDGKQCIRGRICIADLAGSENNKRTDNKGQRLIESSNINKSLLALGAVIDALNKRQRPPYRDSILTRLLSDCLGGNNISIMICCVCGNLKDAMMTRRCLEFGTNTRKIENRVVAQIETREHSNNKENIPSKRNSNNDRERRKKQSGRADETREHSNNKENIPSKRNSNNDRERRKKHKKRKSNERNADDERQRKKYKLNTAATNSSKPELNASNMTSTSSLNSSTLTMMNDDEEEKDKLGSLTLATSPTTTLEKKRKYSVRPTPSKYVPFDGEEKTVIASMKQQIDELTAANKRNSQRIQEISKKCEDGEDEQKEQEQESVEREVAVYGNDQFGLPPTSTSKDMLANIAIDIIKHARKLERDGQANQALSEYQRALKLVPQHQGLRRKINQIQLKFESNVVQQLHFGEDEEHVEEEEDRVKSRRKRKRKKLKSKSREANTGDIKKCEDGEDEQKEQEQESVEREVAVYGNDQFGLPPTSTSKDMLANIAIDIIKHARKLERDGQANQALSEYQRALKLVPQHQGLRRKINQIQLKFESNVVQQLHFGEDEVDEEHVEEEEDRVKSRRKRKRKKLKSKSREFVDEQVSNEEDDDGDDDDESNVVQQLHFGEDEEHVEEEEDRVKSRRKRKRKKLKSKSREFVDEQVSNEEDDDGDDDDEDWRYSEEATHSLSELTEDSNAFSYNFDEANLLRIVNNSTMDELTHLSGIGKARATLITDKRPFDNLSALRKLKGFNTSRGWKNFIEKNKYFFDPSSHLYAE
eukprot:CAMPEP_0197072562 /NCGR_PEP_ID=MMETSP1384-20130603/210159_1 /TAXON_ID=29189 /ORGANISM="Ammonia sp." /LENGTH=1004 /DNA_ID=CAMNT_0042511383 /DNA_START=40 /DNA_END=3056 /DNA_ORIENTATION=-